MNEPGQSRRVLLLTWACVLLGLGLLVVLTQRVERTPDERNYQLAGRVLLQREGLHTVEQRFQGPLILLGTQLTDDHTLGVTGDDSLRRARLGMLVFPALLLLVLVGWARAIAGERAGLAAALLGASNPTLLAYGPLLSSDVAYTATTLLAAAAAWWWQRRPDALRLLLFGLALGANAATKYTAAITGGALLLVLAVLPFAGFDAWPGRDGARRPWWRRALGTWSGLGLACGVALGTLYACYLFASPPLGASAAAALQSPPLQALARLPFGTLLLGLLPQPMVLGLDYQVVVAAQSTNGSCFDLAGNHPAYYPLSLLLKTPLVLLLAAGAGLGVLLRRRATWAAWSTWLIVLVPPLVLLTYVSAARSLQMGIRYVLPMVPALVLLAAAVLATLARPAWLWRATVAVVAAASAWNAVTGWPHFIGFFNQLGGGSVNGFRIVCDGNCDWDQRRVTGREALRQRHAELVFLRPFEGPRCGRVAVYAEDLKTRDPQDLSRTYHWLTRFEPFDHDGAAWLAFDVTPAAFAAAVAGGDRRAAIDLALAWLLVGDLDEARAALALDAAAAASPLGLRARSWIDAIAAAGADPAARDRVADELAANGQVELALALVDRGNRRNTIKIANLMLQTGQARAAVDFLETRSADGSRTIEEVFLLAYNLFDGGKDFPPDPMRALDLMQRGPAPAADSPWAAPWQHLRERVEAAVARERRLEDYK